MTGNNKKDDPEKMAQMHRWLTAVREHLQLEDNPLEAVESELLSLIGTVAHGPSVPGLRSQHFLPVTSAAKALMRKKLLPSCRN